jgi:hypothetical protein
MGSRYLTTMIRTPNKSCYVHRVRLVFDLTGRVQVSDFVGLLRGTGGSSSHASSAVTATMGFYVNFR